MTETSKIDTISKWVTIVLSIGGLSFLYGMAVVQYKIFPYEQLHDAKIAASALYAESKFVLDAALEKSMHLRFPNLWFETERSESGVTVNIPEKHTGGYIFFTDHTSTAYLIDREGNVLHKWHHLFYDIWPEANHILRVTPEENIYWRVARPFPDGSLLAIFEGINQSPYGGGMVKLDKDSNLIWSLDLNTHHDFDLDADGNIFVLTHTFEPEPAPHINDFVTIVSPEGKEIRSYSLLEGFRNSKFFHWMDDVPLADFLHTNNIDILTPEMAESYPLFEEGDLLLSHREKSFLSVVDGKTFIPKWMITGLSQKNHDPDFMDNGHILFLDNDEPDDSDKAMEDDPDKSVTGRVLRNSRILEIDPMTMEIVWSYEESPDAPFYTMNRGSQIKFANGNVLITESTGGRIFEITPAGEIVWEYVTPALTEDSIAVLNWARKYSLDELPFLNAEFQSETKD
jgi:hypothetical protein